MKKDPYNHKKRFENWIVTVAMVKKIDGLNEIHSKLLLSFINDFKVGLNVSTRSKKGGRSFIRLNTIRQRLTFIINKFRYPKIHMLME